MSHNPRDEYITDAGTPCWTETPAGVTERELQQAAKHMGLALEPGEDPGQAIRARVEQLRQAHEDSKRQQAEQAEKIARDDQEQRMKLEAIRAENAMFEQWAEERALDLSRAYTLYVDPNYPGYRTYKKKRTEFAWQAWIERAQKT